MVALATSALDQVFGGLAKSLTPDAAEQFAHFKIDSDTQAVINRLADKAAAGTLSDAEQKQYFELIEAIDVLAIFQAKARSVIGR
jgi:hypothetical protein